MKLTYLAHAAFLLESESGVKLLMDPYESGGFDGAIGYDPIDEIVDAITISHAHADHGYIAPHHKTAKQFNKIGQYQFENIKIKGIKTFHDMSQGKERGENIIFIIRIDEIVICHLGDLGHPLKKDILEEIGKVDVLMLPVGGTFTINTKSASEIMTAINPKICIPMHYKTEKLGFDLAPVDNFISDKINVKQLDRSEIELEKNQLDNMSSEIWVLTPAK